MEIAGMLFRHDILVTDVLGYVVAAAVLSGRIETKKFDHRTNPARLVERGGGYSVAGVPCRHLLRAKASVRSPLLPNVRFYWQRSFDRDFPLRPHFILGFYHA